MGKRGEEKIERKKIGYRQLRNENLAYLQEFKALVCLALGWPNSQD